MKMETPKIELLFIPCPSCFEVDKTRKDFDFPHTMGCCDHCGCDFIVETGEIVLDPKSL
jgi:hypothetical protein